MDVEKKLKSIKASMSFEGFILEEDEIEVCKKILEGEITADEACKKILDKYKISED